MVAVELCRTFLCPWTPTEFSDLYKDINRAGVINTFTVSYVDQNRESLKNNIQTSKILEKISK